MTEYFLLLSMTSTNAQSAVLGLGRASLFPDVFQSFTCLRRAKAVLMDCRLVLLITVNSNSDSLVMED